MKIIPFKQKGKEFVLLDEFNLRHDLHGVQVATGQGLRIFIRQSGNRLIIKVVDKGVRMEGDVKDDKGLVLSKGASVRKEI